jgi:type II secretory pathway component PulC
MSLAFEASSYLITDAPYSLFGASTCQNGELAVKLTDTEFSVPAEFTKLVSTKLRAQIFENSL